jgi:hypothetical protein
VGRALESPWPRRTVLKTGVAGLSSEAPQKEAGRRRGSASAGKPGRSIVRGRREELERAEWLVNRALVPQTHGGRSGRPAK